jgi:glutathione S-transferase
MEAAAVQDPDYTLYYSPGAASMLVHLCLIEIGVPYEGKRVDFERDEQHRPEYLELNPLGVVPTLVISGKPFIESAALLLILSERHPEAGLAPPPGSAPRDAWHQWVVHLSNLGAIYRLWFYPGDLGAPEHDPGIHLALQRRIEEAWNRLDAHLRHNGPYMLGETFSGLDLQLTMLMRWSRKMPRPATQWPALLELARLVTGRPSWKRLYEIEGLAEWYPRDAPSANA